MRAFARAVIRVLFSVIILEINYDIMAKFVLGPTKRKGCYVCGKPIVKFGGNQALVLDGSNGKTAVCSQACADNYNPEVNLDAPDDAPADTPASADSVSKPKKQAAATAAAKPVEKAKKRKPKVK